MKHRGMLMLLLAVIAVGLMGCRARFKKFARTADTVDLSVVVVGAPVVDLVESGGYSNPIEQVVDAAVGTAAQIEGAKIRDRLVSALQPEQVKNITTKGAVEGLGDGPPFGTGGGAASDGTIQIEITGYGIVQSGGGPLFFVDYNVWGYRATDNKKVYRNSVSCSDREFYTPNTPGNLAGTAMTINRLNKMSDEELSAAVQRVVQRCTGYLISEMRRHAS